ncbi:MAG: L-threonylcarbamoyladenylate synthase [Bdellovibrionales bacterium]
MIKAASKIAIDEASLILKSGGLVGMPTETVYGLAANALDGQAVAKIFEAKGRPSFNPLIVHVHSMGQARGLVDFSDDAEAIANAFWPGPLTLILPRKSDCEISELVSAGLPTLAVRMPSHKVALELLKAVDVPLAAPSANRSGSLSPTSPIHVADSLGDGVDMILAAGSCDVGLESTVLDLSGNVPEILRPGAVSDKDIQSVLGDVVSYNHLVEDAQKPKSPGMLLKHYAPDTPLRLKAIDVRDGEALLAFGSIKFMGLKSGGAVSDLPEESYRNLSEDGDLQEAAAHLFAMLKELDIEKHDGIAVMPVPEQGLGVAINDRLQRAAASR